MNIKEITEHITKLNAENSDFRAEVLGLKNNIKVVENRLHQNIGALTILVRLKGESEPYIKKTKEE
jgi:hypothetical protein